MQPPGKAWPAVHTVSGSGAKCLLGKGHLPKYLQMGPAGCRLTKGRDISVG